MFSLYFSWGVFFYLLWGYGYYVYSMAPELKDPEIRREADKIHPVVFIGGCIVLGPILNVSLLSHKIYVLLMRVRRDYFYWRARQAIKKLNREILKLVESGRLETEIADRVADRLRDLQGFTIEEEDET